MAITKVLVVDDSPSDVLYLSSVLVQAGYQVVSASNGHEALTVAKAEQPDLIFLDIVMPEQDGFGTCRRLSRTQETRHIPVVFVTSRDQQADRLWAQMQGAKGFVTKPYTPEDILGQIRALDVGSSLTLER